MPPSKAPVRRKPLVIATANPGKLREFRELLADLPFDVVAQGDLGISSAAETGLTFLENTLIKARHAAAAAGVAAIADDSGLEVDALGGAPGIYSARYAGAGAEDAANNAKLLVALTERAPPAAQCSGSITKSGWSARYRCALAFVSDDPTTAPLTAEAVWEGLVVAAPRGTSGFGYDPYFWIPELGMTVAELAPEDKNRVSHRAAAQRLLRERMAAQLDAAPGA